MEVAVATSLPTSDTYYVVMLTSEHSSEMPPSRMILCEHHYLMATSCLMIRRVINVRSEGTCKFCK